MEDALQFSSAAPPAQRGEAGGARASPAILLTTQIYAWVIFWRQNFGSLRTRTSFRCAPARGCVPRMLDTGHPLQCDYRLQSGSTVCVFNVRGDYVGLSLFNAYASGTQSQYSIASPEFNAAGRGGKGVRKRWLMGKQESRDSPER